MPCPVGLWSISNLTRTSNTLPWISSTRNVYDWTCIQWCRQNYWKSKLTIKQFASQMPSMVSIFIHMHVSCMYVIVDTTDELYKFDYKLRIPQRVAEKVISTYRDENFLSCGQVYGVNDTTNFDINLPIVIQKRQRWPWMAALYVHNVYQCTAALVSRSIAVLAAQCFDAKPRVSDVRLEVLGQSEYRYCHSV